MSRVHEWIPNKGWACGRGAHRGHASLDLEHVTCVECKDLRDRRAAELPPSPQPGTRLVWRQITGDGRYVSEVSAGIDGTIYLTLLPPQNEGEEWGLHRDIGRDCNSFEAASDEAAQVKAEGLVRRFFAAGLAALNSNAPDATAQEGARDGR